MLTRPSGWNRVELGDVAACEPNSFVDGPFGSNLKTNEYSDEGIRLIQLQNIGDGFWIDDNRKFIPPRKFEELRRHAAHPGDIAIAKMADPVARACLIPPVAEQFVVVADCIRFAPDLSKYDPRYLVYAINHHDVRLQAEQKSTGTTRQRINLSKLKTLELWVPPLREQCRIAEILDVADEAIRQTEQVIAKLKAVKAGLLHDLLTRGLDEHGHLRDPQAHPAQFKDSPLGRIPWEWKVCQLSEHAPVLGGKRLPYGHSYSETHTGYRYLRVTDFYERPIDFNSLEHLHPETFFALERYEIHDGNLFISIAGSLGYVGVFRPSIPDRTILTENAARIEVSSAFVPEFLALQMNGTQVQNQIEAEKGTGGGVPKLALFRIRNLELVRPSIEEQYRIIAVLNAHDARIQAEGAELAKLCQVKRGLMDDLLTGKVRVSNA